MPPEEDAAAASKVIPITEDSSTPSTPEKMSEPPAYKRGYHLRWSRVSKSVPAADTGGGLLGRRSISSAAASQNRSSSIRMSANGSAAAAAAGSGTSGSVQHTILHSISGWAAPGEVLCLMGPSGSGKTTLLNVLSGRASYQKSGVVSLDGAPITSWKRVRSQVAYVRQQDVLFGHLTVRDQLTYTAMLRLPSTEDKLAQVERSLQLLRLENVADSPIRLISGGEKKRVNIGTELLTDPRILMLDEPTSGLDSTNAVALLHLLQRKIARDQGKTVITSIHQPSSPVFFSFDRVLMLAHGGHPVYFGTPQESLRYLQTVGLPCPDGYNVADHWMDLLVKRKVGDEAIDGDDDEEEGTRPLVTTMPPCEKLQISWDGEAVAQQVDAEVTRDGRPGEGGEDDDDDVLQDGGMGSWLPCGSSSSSKYNTSWSTQYYYLTHRALKNSRSAIFTPLNLIKSIAIGIVVGLLWFQRSYTESQVHDIRSYYFFTMTFWVFDSMFQALSAFPTERDVVLKERASGSYHLSAYFLAKTTSDGPVRLTLPFLYMCISFWMAGISSDGRIFLGTVGCTLLSVVSGEAIGLLVGAAIYDLQMGMTVMTICTLALMLLGGFFVENVPSFIAWGKFLSPFKYAFDSSLQLVFSEPMPCDGSGALEELCLTDASDITPKFVSPSDLHDFLGVQGSIGFNVGMLILIGLLPRYGAYWALRSKKDGERS